MFKILILIFTFIISTAFANDIGYSGRLVKVDGSPVTGSPNLKFEITYSGTPSSIECSETINSVPLNNGVFNVKLNFDATTTCIFNDVLNAVPGSESVRIRVTDLTNTAAYDYQSISNVPLSYKSEISKTAEAVKDGSIVAASLNQMSASTGQVLKWNGSAWAPAADGGAAGTITDVTAGLGVLKSGIATSPTLALDVSSSFFDFAANKLNLKDGSVTPVKIPFNTQHFDAANLLQLNLKLNTAGAITSTVTGLGVNVDNTTLEIVGNQLRVKSVSAGNVPDAEGLNTSCADGKVLKASGGSVVCSDDDDTNTQLTDSQVDTFVANELTAGKVAFKSGTELADSQITQDGKAGFGTSNPLYNLHVNGTNARVMIGDGTNSLTFGQWDTSTNRIESVNRELFLTSYSNGISFGNAGVKQMALAANGYLGIGTTAPTSSLTIERSDNAGIRIQDGTNNVAILGDFGAGSDGQLGLYDGAGVLTTVINGGANSYFTGGNIGIGTTTPESALDVRGTTGILFGDGGATDAQWGEGTIKKVTAAENYIAIGTTLGTEPDAANNVAEALVIKRKGNVGIGTNAPSAKLDINGDMNVNGTFNVNPTSKVITSNTTKEYAGFFQTSQDHPTCAEKARIYDLGTINATSPYYSFIEIEVTGSHRGYNKTSYFERKKFVVTVGDRVSSNLIESVGESNKIAIWNGSSTSGLNNQIAAGQKIQVLVNPGCGATMTYSVNVKYSKDLNFTPVTNNNGFFTFAYHSNYSETITSDVHVGGNLKVSGVPKYYKMPAMRATFGDAGQVAAYSGSNLQFKTEQYDVGNNYDPATYIFTAPVNGIYHINTQIAYNAATTARRSIALYVNGVMVNYTDFAANSTGGDDWDSGKLVTDYQLNAGDQVSIRMQSTNIGASDFIWQGAASKVGHLSIHLITGL